jgi:hypothetical protein
MSDFRSIYKVGDKVQFVKKVTTVGGCVFEVGEIATVVSVYLQYIEIRSNNRLLTTTLPQEKVVKIQPVKNLEEKAMKKLATGDLIVGSQLGDNGAISISNSPSVHDSRASAEKEAKRLAGVFPEKSFLVLQVQGRATTQKVIFE